MSEFEDFMASREARREATRPGRHYDPAAYLANQRILESALLESLAREKAEQRKQAARRADRNPIAGQSARKAEAAGVETEPSVRSSATSEPARAHVPPPERQAKRHWYSLRRWGHA